jgi:hypothetical protein
VSAQTRHGRHAQGAGAIGARHIPTDDAVPQEAVKMAEKRMVAINRAWDEINERQNAKIATYNVEWFSNLRQCW